MTGALRVMMFQGVTYGLQVVFMLLAARFLGPDAQGQYALYRTGVYLIEAFMWFGLTSGIPYFIAKDHKKYHDVLLSLSLTYVSVVTVLGTGAFTLVLPSLTDSARVGYLLIAWIVALGLSQILLRVFLGERRYDLYNYGNLIGVVVLFASLIVFKTAGSITLVNVILCNVWANIGTLLFALVVHRRKLGGVRFSASFPPAIVRELYGVGMLGYVSSVGFLVLYRIDFFLVGYFLTARQLGIYAVAVLIVEGFQKVPDWLGMILAPKVAAGADPRGEITIKYAGSGLLFVGCIGGVLLIIHGLHLDLVTRVVGHQYQEVQTIVLWLMPRAMLHGVMAAFAGNLAGKGYSAYHPAAGIAAAVFLVMFDLWLIPAWGLEGAVTGITAAYVAATGIMILGYRRLTGQPATAVNQEFVS